MAWLEQFAGVYWNEELGRAHIGKKQGHYWVQFEEWGSVLGYEADHDDSRLLFVTTPLWRGVRISVMRIGEFSLLIDESKYVFRKQSPTGTV